MPYPTVGTYLWKVNLDTSGPGHCVEVGGWRTDDLAPTNLYSCHFGANQQWRLNYATANYDTFYLQNVNSGRCLDVAGWSTNYGAPVIQYYCHLGANQQWRLLWDEQRGYAQFQNVNSGLCLSADGYNSADFTPMVQNQCYWWADNERFIPMIPS